MLLHHALLKRNMFLQRQDELMLSEAFHEGVRHARQSSKQAGTAPHIINFDWHGMIRDIKEKESVRCLWEHLQGLLPQSDLSCGTMEAVPQQGVLTADTRFGSTACCAASSRSVMRYNGGRSTAGRAYGRYQVCLNSLLCCLKQICHAVHWRQSNSRECLR